MDLARRAGELHDVPAKRNYVGERELFSMLITAGKRARWFSGDIHGASWSSESVRRAFEDIIERRLDELDDSDPAAHAAAWMQEVANTSPGER